MTRIYPKFIHATAFYACLTLLLLSCATAPTGPRIGDSRAALEWLKNQSDRSPANKKSKPADFTPLDQLNPRKKTVCAMTFNSTEEMDTFRARLSPEEFQFVELAKDTGDPSWLSHACAAKVQCDVLVVSGHFGGSFFGDRGDLALADMESASCEADCSGIFRKPKEVFLFGCNTLAGKKKDRRTPEEYRRALQEHTNYTGAEIDQIVALRYSPLGLSFNERMRGSFAATPNIYGFDSIAPSGKNTEPFLKAYLKETGARYEKWLDSLTSPTTNEVFLRHFGAKKGMTSVVQEEGAGDRFSATCHLQSSKIPLEHKVLWVEQALRGKEGVVYAPAIRNFLKEVRNTETSQYSYSSLEAFSRIYRDTEAKDHFLKLIPGLDGYTFVQIEMYELAFTLGWLKPNEYKQRVTQTAYGNLKRAFKLEDKDLLCSLSQSTGVEMSLPFKDVPEERWRDPYFLAGLACTEPSDNSTLAKMVDYLETGKEKGVLVDGLGQSKTRLKQVHMALAKLLAQDVDTAPTAGTALQKLKPQDLEVQRDLWNTMKTTNSDAVKKAAAMALTGAQVRDEKLLNEIFDHVSAPENRQKTGLAVAVLASGALPEPLLARITQFIRSKADPVVRVSLVSALMMNRPSQEWVHEELLQAFIAEDLPSLRNEVKRTLRAFQPKSEALQRTLVDVIVDKKSNLYGEMSTILEACIMKSKDLRRIMEHYISDDSLDVLRRAALLEGYAVARFHDEQSLSFLESIIRDKSSHLRRYAIAATGKAFSGNTRAFTLLFDLFQNESDEKIIDATADALSRNTLEEKQSEAASQATLTASFDSPSPARRKGAIEIHISWFLNSSVHYNKWASMLLHDKDKDVRERAAAALLNAASFSPEIRRALEKAKNSDPSEDVRALAETALTE